MAWRPYENLIEGEIDNTTPGKVTGWIKFFRRGRKTPITVRLELKGDFHEDIRGKKIRIINPEPKDRNEVLGRKGTYMVGVNRIQKGKVGDITAGIPVNWKVHYVDYPYIEWFSESNGRIVLELDQSQLEIVEDKSSFLPPLTEEEKKKQKEERHEAFWDFMRKMAKGIQEKSS